MLLNSEQLTQSACGLLADFLLKNQLKLACAESCTGGLIAAACTSLAGSSTWFERGLVTYSNDAKTELLGVDPALIAQHGAVSAEVALAMALGVLQRAPVQVALAVTGIAGPGGATPGKPVGTVWFGWAWNLPQHSGQHVERMCFNGDRAQVRAATTVHSLQRVLDLLTPSTGPIARG
jgi:nicotinamide-nucleotide amidase